MSKIVFALVVLVAMISSVLAVAPVQLSGNVGENLSKNLTDDNEFMNSGYVEFVPTSVVITYTVGQGAAHGGNNNVL
jgi:hypothetical protein